jgi:CspA family cold shock protein
MSDFRRPPIKAESVTVTVKWFNATKGFGFVQLDDGTDAFLHASVLVPTGHDELTDGSTLVCDISDGAKGQQVAAVHEVTLAEGGARQSRPPRRDFGDRGGFGGGDRGGFGGGDRGGFGGGRDRGGFGGGDRGGYGGDRGGFGGGDRGDRGGFGGGGRSAYGPPRGERGGYGDRDQGPATVVDGTVKFYNAEKGYGFIAPDDGSPDVFVSGRVLERTGVASLDTNQRVRVSARQGQKGMVASNVELL